MSDVVEVPRELLSEAVSSMEWAGEELVRQCGGRGRINERAGTLLARAGNLALHIRTTRAPVEPETYHAPEDDEGDGWPPGYSYERSGAFYAVFTRDGDPVKSETASGKWLGEDAAQEAAWAHFQG